MQDAITVDYVNPELTLEHGWVYSSTGTSGVDYPSSGREQSGLQPQAKYLYELYQKGNPEFTGTISVPVLWVWHFFCSLWCMHYMTCVILYTLYDMHHVTCIT